jgi:formate dehydrogenase subunit gamma
VSSGTADRHGASRVRRHALADRLFHWLMAVAVFVLLATGFLPVLGVQFDWVVIHWVAGLALLALVVFHVVRALGWQNWREMWIGPRDLRQAGAHGRWIMGGPPPPRPGKYLFSQKLYHMGIALVLLVTIVTGLMMMVRVETPFWERNPYWLTDGTWGVVYALHGLASLLSITMIMLHVYFALRPEKFQFLRSMVAGWVTREEAGAYHDVRRWPGERQRVDTEPRNEGPGSTP